MTGAAEKRGASYARIGLLVVLTLFLATGLIVGLVAGPAAGMSSQGQRTSASPTVIKVVAGSPSARSFKLSQSVDLPPGIFLFKVTSTGHAAHSFKLCTMPVTSAKPNNCTGVATKTLQPGRSATLTVTLIEPGRYEYLSTVRGQAAAGMKGLIGVGVNLEGVPAPIVTATSTTTKTCSSRCPSPTTTTTATKPPALETLIGDPTVGAALFSSLCASCHTLAAAQATGATGPNLDEFAPTQTQVVGYVNNGGDAMPAFGGTLTDPQINGLAAFVYRSTHGS